MDDLPADFFASTDDLLKFTGLAYLNAQLDAIVPHRRGATLDKPNRAWTHERQLEHLTNLLTRKNDVVACALGSAMKSVPAGDEAGEFVNVLSPHILIAANSRKDSFRQPDQGDGDIPQLQVEAVRIDESLKLQIRDVGVVRAVLNGYKEHNGKVLFDIHVGWFVGLLKDCHLENQDAKSYEEAYKNMHFYVFLVSHGKMLARMKAGMNTSVERTNLWDTLTTDPDSFPGDPFNKYDIDEDLLKLKPTKDQAGMWEVFSAKSKKAYAAQPLYDVAGRKAFHKGIAHTIIEAFEALTALSAKWDNPREETWKLNESAEAAEIEHLLWRAISAVVELNTLLLSFNNASTSPLLSRHFTWLFRVARVNGVRDRSTFSTASTATTSPKPSAIKTTTAEDVDEPDEVDELLERIRSDRDNQSREDPRAENIRTRPSHEASAALSYLRLVCLHASGLRRACVFNLSHRNEVKSKQIRHAEMTVVDMRSAEWDGIHKTRPSLKDTLDLVFSSLNFWQQEYEMDRKHIEGWLTRSVTHQLKKKHKLRDDRDAAKDAKAANKVRGLSQPLKQPEVRNKAMQDRVKEDRANEITMRQQSFLNATDEAGAMHCETILMSATILFEKLYISVPNLKAKLNDNNWLRRNVIVGLKGILLDILQKPMPLLNLTKRCCPACLHIFEQMLKNRSFGPKRGRVEVSEYHTKWSLHHLPPFLPKEYVDSSIENALEEAKRKLRQLPKERAFKDESDEEQALKEKDVHSPPSHAGTGASESESGPEVEDNFTIPDRTFWKGVLKDHRPADEEDKDDGSDTPTPTPTPKVQPSSTKSSSSPSPGSVTLDVGRPTTPTPKVQPSSTKSSSSPSPGSVTLGTGRPKFDPPFNFPLHHRPGRSPDRVREREEEEPTSEEPARANLRDKFDGYDADVDE